MLKKMIMITLGTCILLCGCRVVYKDADRAVEIDIDDDVVKIVMMEPNKVD